MILCTKVSTTLISIPHYSVPVMQDRGWDHLPSYNRLDQTSNPPPRDNSSALSPSLQSYFSPYDLSWPTSSTSNQERDPASICRAETERTATSRGRNRSNRDHDHHVHVKDNGSTIPASFKHAAPGRHPRIKRGKPSMDLSWKAVPLTPETICFLEEGWDGRTTLGKRAGQEQRFGVPRLSTSRR